MNSGKVVGGVLFMSAAAAVWLWPRGTRDELPEEPVRPVRSLVVESGFDMPDISFTGEIEAFLSRRLSFKQDGRIQRIPVVKGQRVKKGEKLAWLDPHDFENRLAKADAAVQRDRLSFSRISEAAKRKAVSREELSRAEAQLNQSEAEFALAKRALEETVLVAPFDCTVADVPGTELEMSNPLIPVVTVQDTSSVKVNVNMAERYVILYKQLKPAESGFEFVISFDSVPGKTYPVRFVEFQASTSLRTQTYVATYVMDQPEDLLLLPGMSARVTLLGRSYLPADRQQVADAVMLPENAVGVDADGSRFVWVLTADADDARYHRVTRRSVEVTSRTDLGLVVRGVAPGERIATAGITLLSEGRRVSLLK